MFNQEIIESLFLELSSQFSNAFRNGEDAAADLLATTMKVNTKNVDFSWLGDQPEMRKWIGQRVIRQLKNFRYSATYEEYELTLAVKKMDILDNNLGHYSIQSFNGGEGARLLRPRLIGEAINAGETLPCYDGQNFFDTAHPVGDDGDVDSVSNLFNNGGTSAANPWYMADLSRGIKPIIYLDRLRPEFQSFTSMQDMHVFLNREYLFGCSSAAGTAYGLWQTMAKNENLPTVNEILATDLAMTEYRSDTKNEDGRRKYLGIKPTHIVCGPALRQRMEALLNSPHLTDYAGNPLAPGATDTLKPNPVYGKYQLIVNSWLD